VRNIGGVDYSIDEIMDLGIAVDIGLE